MVVRRVLVWGIVALAWIKLLHAIHLLLRVLWHRVAMLLLVMHLLTSAHVGHLRLRVHRDGARACCLSVVW